MVGSAEPAERDMKCDVSGKNVMEALQVAGQVRTPQTSSWLPAG